MKIGLILIQFLFLMIIVFERCGIQFYCTWLKVMKSSDSKRCLNDTVTLWQSQKIEKPRTYAEYHLVNFSCTFKTVQIGYEASYPKRFNSSVNNSGVSAWNVNSESLFFSTCEVCTYHGHIMVISCCTTYSTMSFHEWTNEFWYVDKIPVKGCLNCNGWTNLNQK